MIFAVRLTAHTGPSTESRTVHVRADTPAEAVGQARHHLAMPDARADVQPGWVDRVEDCEVTSYDAATGIATVRWAGGGLPLHTGAFYSGRPGRHPRIGDRLSATVRHGMSGSVVLSARLVRT